MKIVRIGYEENNSNGSCRYVDLFTGDMCFRGGTTKAKQRGGAVCFVQL